MASVTSTVPAPQSAIIKSRCWRGKRTLSGCQERVGLLCSPEGRRRSALRRRCPSPGQASRPSDKTGSCVRGQPSRYRNSNLNRRAAGMQAGGVRHNCTYCTVYCHWYLARYLHSYCMFPLHAMPNRYGTRLAAVCIERITIAAQSLTLRETYIHIPQLST